MYRYSNGKEFHTTTEGMRQIHRVNNHRIFAYFNYVSEPNNTYMLGDVVSKTYEDEDGKITVEIGVVIQTYSNGEYRTDMYGNSCADEDMPATLSEIREYRPELLEYII